MAFRPHPGDFENEDFSAENDPGGLREFCYTQIKRLGEIASISKTLMPEEPEEGTRTVRTQIHYELNLDDSDPVIDHLVMQLTRTELEKLLQITLQYKELVVAEIPKPPLEVPRPTPPDVFMSLDTFFGSKMIARLLCDSIEKALEQQKD